VVTDRSLSVRREALSIDCSSSMKPFCVRSRPRNMFATTSRLSASARSWYTNSIPSLEASRGLWIRTG
jgi:hypothetical protein